MTIRYLNPVQTAEIQTARLAPRLRDLRGARIGLLSNGKTNANRLLDLVVAELRASHGIGETVRLTKIGASGNCPEPELAALVADCDAVITAIGD